MNVVNTQKPPIGVNPRKTGLPFYVWFISCHGEHIELETSPDSSGNDLTVYRIMPSLMRRRGPYVWSNLSMVTEFRRLNLPLIKAFWNGEVTGGQEVIDRVTPVPKEFVDDALIREAEIQHWRAAQEDVIAKTGVIPREYKPYRLQPPDHTD